MAEKQYQEWLKYRKWYKKQESKGFTFSENAADWYDSYDEYKRQYDYMKKLKQDDAKLYKDKSYYDMIQSRSYQTTSTQSSYFYDRISGVLNDLEVRAAGGDNDARDLLNDFYVKYGDVRTVDKQELIYRGLKEGSLQFEYHDSKHYGWTGNLMDMMNYFQMNGLIDQIYV